MSVRGLFDSTGLADLKQVLDLAATRQRAYASNIANASVPSYDRLDVPFSEELSRSSGRLQLKATQPGHTRSATSGGTPPQIKPVLEGGETVEVDLDLEMVAVAENQLRFNLAARLSALQIAGLRAAISGRR